MGKVQKKVKKTNNSAFSAIHTYIKLKLVSFFLLFFMHLPLNSVSGRRFFTDQRSSWGKSLVASRGNTPGQQPASRQGCEVFRISSFLSLLFFHWSAQTTSGRLSSLGGGRCLGGEVQGVLKEHLQPKRHEHPHRGGTCNSIHILLFIDLHIIAYIFPSNIHVKIPGTTTPTSTLPVDDTLQTIRCSFSRDWFQFGKQ